MPKLIGLQYLIFGVIWIQCIKGAYLVLLDVLKNVFESVLGPFDG